VLTCKRCGQEQELHEGVRDATAARLDTHHGLRDTDHAYGFFGRPEDLTGGPPPRRPRTRH
jgi:hypothetical protein